MKLRWTRTPDNKWTQVRAAATPPPAPRSASPDINTLYANAVAMMFGREAAKVRAVMPSARR